MTEEDWEQLLKKTNEKCKKWVDKEVFKAQYSVVKNIIQKEMTEECGHISDAFHLSEQEIRDLRESKKELTEYGKQKLKKLMNEKPLSLGEMQDIANQREDANKEYFYQYRVIDYMSTGEGRTIYLQISRNNYSNEFYQQKWEKFIDNKYLLQDVEELTETQFLERYTRLIPNAILRLHREKTLTIWQQHFHFNRS